MSKTPTQRVDPRLLRKASFRFWSSENIRFCDTDLIGHVNNTAYTAYCETGRVAFNRVLFGPVDRTDTSTVLARLTVHYLRESHFPGTVDIGTAVGALGHTSVTLVQGLFVGETAVAAAEAVIVCIDPGSRRPLTLPAFTGTTATAYFLPAAD